LQFSLSGLPFRGTGRRCAFTLIELLVVIAIIAVLVSILLPSLGAARRSARSLRCLANVRSLVIAHTAYADDYKGAFIDVGLAHGGSGDEQLSWVNTLSEYYAAPLAIRSPGDASVYWPAEAGGQGLTVNGAARRTSYGINNWLSRTYNPGISEREPFDRHSKIDMPSAVVQFLLMTESGDYAVSDHTHAENWGTRARAAAVAAGQVFINKWGGPPASGQGRSNYGFLDGHAALKDFQSVYLDRDTNAFDPRVAR